MKHHFRDNLVESLVATVLGRSIISDRKKRAVEQRCGGFASQPSQLPFAVLAPYAQTPPD